MKPPGLVVRRSRAVSTMNAAMAVLVLAAAIGFLFHRPEGEAIPWLGGAVVKIGIEAISLVYFALIAWQGFDNARSAFAIDKRTTAELNYPMGPAYALVVVGSVVLCLWLVRDIVALARGEPRRRGHADADPMERPQE